MAGFYEHRWMFVSIVVGILMAGVIAAPELTAFATEMITGADIKDNSITHLDIDTSAVRSQELASNGVTDRDIAEDAVGARELKGVDELIFATCEWTFSDPRGLIASVRYTAHCPVPGVEADDRVIATIHEQIDVRSGGSHPPPDEFPGQSNTLWVIAAARVNESLKDTVDISVTPHADFGEDVVPYRVSFNLMVYRPG